MPNEIIRRRRTTLAPVVVTGSREPVATARVSPGIVFTAALALFFFIALKD